MSKIEEVITALERISDDIDTTSRSAGAALERTDVAMAEARALGDTKFAVGLGQIRTEVEKVRTGAGGLREIVEVAIVHAQVVGGHG